ncbi:IS66 family insertion sequence element accessory protein TnpA [Pectinatus sottacetonis]|uniref:IS66 family insertion sequence element accessory protein TnpA n=1 Tax=Pectinatus sottacetonis TaxID=1002795 RepID=UPI0038B280F4
MQQWRKYLKERAGSNLTVKSFCEKYGLNVKSYYYWQKIIRNEAAKSLVGAIVPVNISGACSLKSAAVPAKIIIRYGDFCLETRDNIRPQYLEETLALFIKMEQKYAR